VCAGAADDTFDLGQVALYCHNCQRAFPGGVPHRCGDASDLPGLIGLHLVPQFVTEEEEQRLVSHLDAHAGVFPGWKMSQSGRSKQDFGPQANFKKQKVKLRELPGVPSCLVGLRDLASQAVEKLTGSRFQAVEMSALDYRPSTGSSLDSHIDDTWIWGPRVVGISLLSATLMSFERDGVEILVPLPPRSLFLLSGPARSEWKHGIRAEAIQARRVSVTMRELNPASIDENTMEMVNAFAATIVPCT